MTFEINIFYSQFTSAAAKRKPLANATMKKQQTVREKTQGITSESTANKPVSIA